MNARNAGAWRCALALIVASACHAQPARLPDDVAKIAYMPAQVATRGDSITTEPFDTTYELQRDLTEGFLEIAGEGAPTRIKLPDLRVGTHTVTVPAGFRIADDPQIFSCNFADHVTGSGITMFIDLLWTDAYRSENIYDYKPEPPPADRGDFPLDDAAAFRRDERAISAYGVPDLRNVALKSKNEPPEMEISGVGFAEGTPVTCTKGRRHDVSAQSVMRNVKVVSTAAHDNNGDIPVLLAGTFTVPALIATHGNEARLIGRVKR